ncbi:MAG: hypothetical protein GQ580_01060, partial [Candidatus Thorarchaeota archaeon]|nr:hypothetical protein [Candidatus Thorarchaeota archaeon]
MQKHSRLAEGPRLTAGGYTGRILRVQLNEGDFKVDKLPQEWIRDYIGGDGFAAKLLFEEVPAACDPLSS